MESNQQTGAFFRFGNTLFDHRKVVLAIIFLVTGWFAWHIPTVRMLSDFADLLPQEHPYIQLHNSIRDTFGGANIIVISVEVEEGTIFNNETLARIHRITEGIDKVSNINHNLVTSLTHRNTRKIFLTPAAPSSSQTPTTMPQNGEYSEELDKMHERRAVEPARLRPAGGSPDMKVGWSRARSTRASSLRHGVQGDPGHPRWEAAEGVTIYATGHPMLVGWIDSYSGQILQIFMYTILHRAADPHRLLAAPVRHPAAAARA
jgi:uncharacterized protein